MREHTRNFLIEISAGLTACAGILLCGLFIDKTIARCIFCLCIALALIVFLSIDGQRHMRAYRISLVVYVTVSVVSVLYIIYYSTGLADKFNDFDAIKAYILDSGYWGVAIFLGLTIFQVVILPVPAALTIVLGVAIYGPTISFILSTIGTFIGSFICFVLGKVCGRRLCNWMFGEETTEKYARLINDRGKWLFVLMLLLPMFPDDTMCTVAGLTAMSYGYFIVVCVITRPVMIAVTAYLGSGVIPFSGWGIPVWIGIAALLVFIMIAISRFKSSVFGGTGKASKDKKFKKQKAG